MFGVVCLLLAIILILGWAYVQQKYSFFRNRGILYVKPIFPLGNFHVQKLEDFNSWSKELYFKFRGRDVLGGVFIGLSPQLVVTDLDVINDILVRDFISFPDHGKYFGDDRSDRDPLMPSLYTLRGEIWRHMRTKLTPAFSFTTSEKFDTVNECATKLCDYVRVMSEDPINAKDLSLRYICDVLGSSIFGIDCRGMLDEDPVLINIAHRIYNPNRAELLLFLLFSFLNWDVIFGDFSTKYTRKFIKVIDEVIKFREDNNLRRDDIMQVFLDIKKNNKMVLDDESGECMGNSSHEVHGEAYFLFCFGYHNTRITLSSALFELASNQGIQSKARNEIVRVLNSNESLDNNVLDQMVYLQQIIDETLRKYPGTSHVERMAQEDYITRKGRHFIKKGTSIIIPVFGIHNDPLIYPDPERFNPDRMSKDQMRLRHPNSFMPFGGGPRACIGQRFALIQVKLAIIQLLCTFQLSVHNWTKQPINANFDVTSDKDIWLDIHPL